MEQSSSNLNPLIPVTWERFILSPPSPQAVVAQLLAAQEPIQAKFFRLQVPPRALQEAPKRILDAFRVEDAIRTLFGTHFGLRKQRFGPQKSKKSFGELTFFAVSTFSALFGFGTSLGILWEFLWGSIRPPGHLKPVSSAPLGRPRADQD